MSLKPWNRRLWVEVTKQANEEEKPQILLPEDYKPKSEQDYHTQATVLACAEDANQLLQDKKIIVQTNGLEEVTVNDKTHYLVVENYIVCVLEE